MKIITMSVGLLSTNCYTVYDEKTKNGIIIDPGSNGKQLVEMLRREQINIVYIVFTHVHFDHIFAYYDIKREFPNSKLIVGEKDVPALTDKELSLVDYARVPYVTIKEDITVRESDKITVDSLSFDIIETPGHTTGSISLYSDKTLFSGDTLFFESMGRCDFPNGNIKLEADSIINKLFKLPTETVVYPGHGEKTTIGYEKEHNSIYQWI